MWPRLIVMFAVCLLACVGTLYAISNPGRAALVGTGDAAAWIQAWWSIAAIVVAVTFPGLETAVRENAEYRRQKTLLGEVVGAAERLLRKAAESGSSGPSADQFGGKTPAAPWVAVRDSLVNFPVTGLRTAKEVQDLMVVRGVMAQSVDLLERSHRGVTAYVLMATQIGVLLSKVDDSFRALQK